MITAVVIGGTALRGGRAISVTIAGAVIGDDRQPHGAFDSFEYLVAAVQGVIIIVAMLISEVLKAVVNSHTTKPFSQAQF